MTAHWVYRCFDVNRLIYVGKAKDLRSRLMQHDHHTWWSDQVVKVRATVHSGSDAARLVELDEIRIGNPRWNARDRWPHRASWVAEDYKDYLYATLRFGTNEGLKSWHVQQILRVYRQVFDEPLRDPRIDNYEWPGYQASRARYRTPNRKYWHPIPKEGAA